MHPRLKDCALKAQESLFLYNFRADERYELDSESFEFLRFCTGKFSLKEIIKTTGADEKEAREFIEYLTSEGCVEDRRLENVTPVFDVPDPVLPSLRYLQLHITERCNLNCAHCYLGEKEQKDLEPRLIEKALSEFSPNGLKLLITGGEALKHKKFWKIVDLARKHPIRIELLSNGTLITPMIAKKLSGYIHSVQISLDGTKEGHEFLRGPDSFEKTVEGIKNAAKFLDVSIATMVHAKNLNDFKEMVKLVDEVGAKEWTLDIPSLAGNATADVIASALSTAEIFKRHGFGTGVHEGDEGYSCGSHICTINVEGGVSKCGFFEDAVGNIKDENLMALWKRVVAKYNPKVTELECAGCEVVEECRGGCRYRAQVSGSFLGKDPFMCMLHLGAGNER
jgi:radical SAM protein with 4Fe4S-binding SPASM domain